MIRPLLYVVILFVCGSWMRQTDPWTPAQLMEPADLAAALNHSTNRLPLLVCVGPSGIIKGSIETGPAHEPQN
ncbi:MAG TPA: hypothetical protein VKU83_11895, partial [Puia sp.]|nr:hypothetical protein [Puia sp.]